MNINHCINQIRMGVLLALLLLVTRAFASDVDPLALQQQAIKRIDNYLDFVRKTGDFKSRLPDLMQADGNAIFETRKDWSTSEQVP